MAGGGGEQKFGLLAFSLDAHTDFRGRRVDHFHKTGK